MFSFRFICCVLFFGICAISKNEQQKNTLEQCQLELNQSTIRITTCEKKLKNETDQQNVEINSQLSESKHCETIENVNVLKSYINERFENQVKKLIKNLKYLTLNLQRIQVTFEKIKTEANQNEQISKLVIEISYLNNLEWFESGLELIVSRGITDVHCIRDNNITYLLQHFQEFKSNLQKLKTSITDYEIQLKKETEMKSQLGEQNQNKQINEFVTLTTTSKPRLNQEGSFFRGKGMKL